MIDHIPPRRILTAVDFSAPSLSALAAALNLAERFGSDLEVVYALEPAPVDLGLAPAFALPEPSPERVVERLRKACAGHSGRLRLEALRGPAAPVILSRASGGKADLIVMGTHGHEGLDRFLFGSVAANVLARSAVPVLTTRGQRADFNLRRILCPFDLTPRGAQALLAAQRLAQVSGAFLTVLYIRPETLWEEDARLELRAALRGVLGPASSALPILLAKGEPRRVIAREAQRGGYDLIVLREHQRAWSRTPVLAFPKASRQGQTARRSHDHPAAASL